MHKIVMEGRRCALGEMIEEYLPMHTNYMNDPEVNRFIHSRPPFTVEKQREWLRQGKRVGDQVLAILVSKPKDSIERFTFVGVVDLHNIDPKERTANSGSVIGNKRYWRRGIAREAKLMQLKIAFDDLKLNWIYSRTIRPNVSSQRLLESSGYKLFDVCPEARLVDGVLHDELYYRVSCALWLPYWNRYCEQV